MGMKLWDNIPEASCVIHLHNFLVTKGHISHPIGLYLSFQNLFPTSFFANGKVPTSEFLPALVAVTCPPKSRREENNRRALLRATIRAELDVHRLLDPSNNKFFKQKSFLRLYRDADWNHERLSDEELPHTSSLNLLRIAQTKQFTDPVTGKKIFERTFLVKRALALGFGDEKLMEMISMIEKDQEGSELLRPVPTFGQSALGTKVLQSEVELLEVLQQDILRDICGQRRPLSSLNYGWVTAEFFMLFTKIEERLKELGNPSWVRAYEKEPAMMRCKRLSLTMIALNGEDEELLRVMGEEFEKFRSNFVNTIYWEELHDWKTKECKDPLDHMTGIGCTLM